MTNEELTIEQHNVFILHCQFYIKDSVGLNCDRYPWFVRCNPSGYDDCYYNLSEKGKNKYNNIIRRLKLLKVMANDK